MTKFQSVLIFISTILLASCSSEEEKPQLEIADFRKTYDSGNLIFEGQKIGKKRIGSWNWYYPDGTLFKRKIYDGEKPGSLVQSQEYYSNSILKEDVRLLPMSTHEFRSYLKTEYHIDGLKDAETQYEVRVFYNGEGYEHERTEGVKTTYDAEGRILFKVYDPDQGQKYREWYNSEGVVIGAEYEDDL